MGDSFRVRIAAEGGRHVVAAWHRRLVALPWPHTPASAPVWLLDESDEPADAVLFLNEGRGTGVGGDRPLFERCAARSVPVVTIGGGIRPQLGLQLPEESEPAAVLAALSALAVRSREVLCLQHELALATRVAQGVEAELGRLDEELQYASLLQQEFLPRPLPQLDALEYAALWRPASSVSGDLYDVFRLDATHVGVFLADAVGHGVPAALQAMMLCRSLPTRDLHDRFHRLLSPAEALSRLNCEMADRQGRIGRYATALYAIIDCRTRVVRLASAGSPVPMVFRAGGPVEAVDASGPLLGIAPQQTYDEVTIELGPSDRLLVHSDGFERAFPDEARRDDRLGPRYIDELTALRDEISPTAMIERLARRLDHERGSLHQHDDCTLLVIRPTAHAAVLAA